MITITPHEAYYYATTDENGVLCVDQLEEGHRLTMEQVARLAWNYPEVIYFVYGG